MLKSVLALLVIFPTFVFANNQVLGPLNSNMLLAAASDLGISTPPKATDTTEKQPTPDRPAYQPDTKASPTGRSGGHPTEAAPSATKSPTDRPPYEPDPNASPTGSSTPAKVAPPSVTTTQVPSKATGSQIEVKVIDATFKNKKAPATTVRIQEFK